MLRRFFTFFTGPALLWICVFNDATKPTAGAATEKVPCPNSCSTALAVSTGTTKADASCLPKSASTKLSSKCSPGGLVANWFKFTAPKGCHTATASLKLTGKSKFTKAVAVFTDTNVCPPTKCPKDNELSSSWTWTATPGSKYYILMAYFGGGTQVFSTYDLIVKCA